MSGNDCEGKRRSNREDCSCRQAFEERTGGLERQVSDAGINRVACTLGRFRADTGIYEQYATLLLGVRGNDGAGRRRACGYREGLYRGSGERQAAGPTVYLSAFWVGAKYPLRNGEHVWERTIPYDATPEQLEEYILEAKEFGCIGLKLYNDLSYELLQKIVPLCHKHGLKPWGHFSTIPASALECVQAGIETLSHTYLIEGSEGFTPEGKARRFTLEGRAYRDSVYREIVSRGAILDATTYLCSQGQASLPHNTVFTREAYEAGVTIAAGTDYVDFDHDFQCVLLREMDVLADSCGMKIPDVLRAATVVGAKVLGMEGKVGVIRKGAEADLLLLSSNPLESLTALRKQEALYIDGKKVKR